MSSINLHTRRLHLRQLTPNDAHFFFALNEDPIVMRWVPDEPFDDIESARQFLMDYQQLYPTGFGRLAMIDRSDGEIIGWCGLKFHPDRNEVDLGYRLLRKYWGRGFATEAGLSCLFYGFDQLGLQAIMAHVDVENIGSQRVLEKVGMQQTGPFTEPDWSGIRYEITRAEWLSRQHSDNRTT